MAPIGKRRGRASKTHSTAASTDKAKDSAESYFSAPKGGYPYAETRVSPSYDDMLDMFKNSRGDPKPVNDADKLMVEWNNFMACHLEDSVLEELFDVVVKAIRQIVACGYSEKDAELAVLKSGLYYGIMNPVLNIVNGALIFLEMAEKYGSSKYRIFENLGNLVEYLMLEMVYVLKEVRPSLSVAEAMSGLMMCKMDLAEAFEVDAGTLRSYCTVGHELGESLFTTMMNACPFKDTSAQGWPESDSPHSMHASSRVSHTGNETSKSDPSSRGNSSSKYFKDIGEMFFVKERYEVASKRDMSRQNPSLLERHDKDYMSKPTIKVTVSPWGALVLDKRLKDLNSVNSNTKRTCSECNVAGDNLRAAVHEVGYTARLPVENIVPALPAARPEVHSPASLEPSDIHIGSRYDKSLGKYVPLDEKDKMIQSLASRLLMLKKEHQHLTDWVNENVMQAAQRLRKDQAELKALRQEKKAVGKSEKDKQYTREEDAIKRISEIEYAVASSANHMKAARSTTSQLEEANSVLKKELEAAKQQALESAAILQEALMKEQEAMKRAQSLEGKKSLLQEELSADKRKVAELQIALEKAKGQYIQIEALWKQEEKEKKKLLAKARSIALERERRESLAEKEEHAIRQNAETELQKGKVHIELIESKLLELSSKSDDPSKLSQARRCRKGRSVSYPSEDVCPNIGGARMEWECVMCMTEEKSVVFLPCAHQSLCACCDRLHEEQGLKDCPSCRTPIKSRIRVRFANP